MNIENQILRYNMGPRRYLRYLIKRNPNTGVPVLINTVCYTYQKLNRPLARYTIWRLFKEYLQPNDTLSHKDYRMMVNDTYSRYTL